MSRTCVIPLGRNGQHEAIVDEEDYPLLTKWRWSFKVSAWKYGRKVYARRCIRVGGVKRTIMMHDVILEEHMKRRRPSELHTGHHKNGNSLDNTRGNLGWGSKSTQSKAQKPRISAAERAANDEQRIAA